MMQHYFQRRLAASLDHYFFEREKIVHSGNLEKHFFRTDFDAGFYFRHLNGLFPLIEVNFKIFIIPRESSHFQEYQNRCKIVLPHEELLGDLVMYFGFTRVWEREWEMENTLSSFDLWKQGPDRNGFHYFSATVFIQAGPHLAPYNQLELSLACPSRDLIFNNKSLNYCFSLERPYLVKLCGEELVRRITAEEAFHDEELAPLRRLRDALEHRSWELINGHGLHDPREREARRGQVVEESPDLSESFRSALRPLLSRFITKHRFTGSDDPQERHNLMLLAYCIEHLTPATYSLMGYG